MNETQTFIIAVLASIPTILSGLMAFFVGMQKIKAVHTIVNSQRTEMMAQIETLKATIRSTVDEIGSLQETLGATHETVNVLKQTIEVLKTGKLEPDPTDTRGPGEKDHG